MMDARLRELYESATLHCYCGTKRRRQNNVRPRVSAARGRSSPLCKCRSAGGLSPLDPKLAAMAAGKLLLKEINRLSKARADFAFESTLSGLAYAKRIRRWKAEGYRIEI